MALGWGSVSGSAESVEAEGPRPAAGLLNLPRSDPTDARGLRGGGPGLGSCAPRQVEFLQQRLQAKTLDFEELVVTRAWSCWGR